MRQQFKFDPTQKTVIENGRAVKDVVLGTAGGATPLVEPRFPLITQASDLWPSRKFGFPSNAVVKYRVDGVNYEFWLEVAVNASHKSKDTLDHRGRPDPRVRPIGERCPIDHITYPQTIKLNAKMITNGSYTQSMYVLARVANVLSTQERVDVYSDGNKTLFVEATAVIELSLRTAYSPNAYIPGGFNDRIWDKTVKYLHVPARSGGHRLKVTEGMKG